MAKFKEENNINKKKSVWQSKYFFNKFYKGYNVFNYKTKTSFDLFFYSFLYKKFLNNYSKNYNYSKIYNQNIKNLIKLSSKYNVKGVFLINFLFFNILFFSFFETTNVRVAGRSLKVPNPIMYNKSYRVIPKILSNVVRLKNDPTIYMKLNNEIDLFEQESSTILNFEKNKIKELVDNRMFEHYRWKYTKLKGSVNRLNP